MDEDTSRSVEPALSDRYSPEAARERQRRQAQLLENVKARKERLWDLYVQFEKTEPDVVYRFYHQSFKVFQCQQLLQATFVELDALTPDGTEINDMFARIVLDAISKDFVAETTNPNWPQETRPILEAFFHCKHILNSLWTLAFHDELPAEGIPDYVGTAFELYFLR